MMFVSGAYRCGGRGLVVGVVALLVFVLSAMVGSTAVAFAAGPVWSIGSLADSTVAPGGTLEYLVETRNNGAGATDGSQIDVTASLPVGMIVVSASLRDMATGTFHECFDGSDGTSPVAGASSVVCSDSDHVAQLGPTGFQKLSLTVKVDQAVTPGSVLTASFGVSGGGAPVAASTVDPTVVSLTPPVFGVDAFDGLLGDSAGNPVSQAGAHPAVTSVSLDFNTLTNPTIPLFGSVWPVQPVKDVLTELPDGLVGNPTAVDRCTLTELAKNNGQFDPRPKCPPTSQIGTVLVRIKGAILGLNGPDEIGPLPLFNIVPSPGVPAAFAFNVLGVIVMLDASVRTGGDYRISVDARNTPEALAIIGTNVTFWGVPADPSHTPERACPGEEPPYMGGPSCGSGAPLRAFLRMPTSCTREGEGLSWTARLDSWAEPGAQDANGEPVAGDERWKTAQFVTHEAPGYPYPSSEWGPQVGVTGCESVPFTPSFEAQPTSHTPDTPSGLDVALSIPQEALEDPSVTAQSDVRKVTVVLPEGMLVNPSQANGLQSCTLAQIGLDSKVAPTCPEASKIGTVEVKTPLLEEALKGSVYLAAQNENPFGSLLALYIVAEGSGVMLKLPGRIDLDPATGRLTTTVENLPQQPVSKVSLRLAGGPKAALIAPAACGTSTVQATLEGWSGKNVTLTNPYTVNCEPGMGGFSPSFMAGTATNQAGGFSPFVLSLGRSDGEQRLSGLNVTFAPGLSAVIKGVTRCSDADAATGNCPVSSRIGSVTVAAGAGSEPFALKGTVYLTGPYNGGPFGEAVVVPAVAGPFNLGNVVVRGSIRVNARTGQPTVVSDPFPQFVNQTGIPSEVKRVEVSIDRPGFTFNPTDCNPLQVTGTATSTQGATTPVSSHFQAVNCGALPFKPSFAASTGAKTSRSEGASLDVKVGSTTGQANIAKVKVSLPKQMPSRLDTLKLACTEAVFNANPAACPSASRIGSATANTPLLDSALTGPAYIVSHGGAAFPDVEIVLQGEGITLILDGHTNIDSKTSITTSSFESVPDVPVSHFELNLPTGIHSVLSAPAGKLCEQALVMPTTITAQNGAIVEQHTPVQVTGCKPAIRVLGHSVKGTHASIRVAVPSAGTLVAGGPGIGRSIKQAHGAQTVTIGVTLGKHARQVLAKNPSQRVNAKVTLRFKPKHGASLAASVNLLVG